MEDKKKNEAPAGPAVAATKPLAVQVVDAIIDSAAAIAKSVVVETAERMGRSAAKTKAGKVATSLVKKAEKVAPKPSKKTAPAKKAAAKAAPQRIAPKKTAKQRARKPPTKSPLKKKR